MTSATLGYNPEYSPETLTPEEARALPGKVLLEFGATWCGICQGAQGAIREVMAEYPDLPHHKIFDGKGKPLGRAFKVTLWPTLVLLQGGAEVARVVRPKNADDVRLLFNAA